MSTDMQTVEDLMDIATPQIAALNGTDVVENARRDIDLNIEKFVEATRNLRTQRNMLAPISKLPPEMLSQIFSYCIPTTEYAGWGWIRVTFVCRHWRSIALETPSLWSHFYPSKNIEWTKEILSRSKGSPLSVTYTTDRDHLIPSTKLALKQLSRVKSLQLTDMEGFFDELTTPAPLLESLTVQCSASFYGAVGIISNKMFAATAPRLRKLKLRYYTIPKDSPLLANLTSFEIHSDDLRESFCFTLPELLLVLEKVPLLQVLGFSSAIHHISKDTPLGRPNVNLSRLERLQMSADASTCNAFLGSVDFPPSATLNFNCSNFDSYSPCIPNLLSKFEASVNLEPLHRMAIHYASRTEVTYEAWALAYPDARIHFHLRGVSSEPLSVYTATTGVCKALLLKDLRTLSIRSQDHNSLVKKTWLEAFGDAVQVSTIELMEHPVMTLLDALTPHEDTDAIFFPQLQTMILSEVDFGILIGSLVDCLMIRWEYGSEIPKLVIKESTYIGEEEIEELEEIVVDVGWDGSESYPDEEDDEEDEDDDEEYYSDGDAYVGDLYGFNSDYEDYYDGFGFGF